MLFRSLARCLKRLCPSAPLRAVSQRPPRTRRALDIGLGQGRNAILLAKNGYATTGIDRSEVGVQAARRMAVTGLAIMVIIPAILFGRSTSIGALEHYGKQHVPYGPAVHEILATGALPPAFIVTAEAYLPGNVRLHAPDIPVASLGYPTALKDYPFDAQHPWLAIWRTMDGTPMPEIPKGLKEGVEHDPRLQGAAWTTGMVAPPYNYGRPGDVYSFSYAWIHPQAR